MMMIKMYDDDKDVHDDDDKDVHDMMIKMYEWW